MFGFSGAHRSGKTTLAKDLSAHLGIAYYDASVSRICKELGINSVAHLSIETRIVMQEYLLKRHLEDIAVQPRPCITDRTPLDFVGYMVAEITMHTETSKELQDRIQKYIEDCLEATRLHYDTIIACRPLPFYEIDPTKPPPNRVFQAHHQLIVEGAMNLIRPVVTAFLSTSDHAQRLKASADLITAQLQDLVNDRMSMTIH